MSPMVEALEQVTRRHQVGMELTALGVERGLSSPQSKKLSFLSSQTCVNKLRTSRRARKVCASKSTSTLQPRLNRKCLETQLTSTRSVTPISQLGNTADIDQISYTS